VLSELQIKNFAVVEEVSVAFGEGLNVLSGETGSGKSILLRALELLLGGRPRSDLVRTGADRWEIAGLFDLTKLAPAVRESLPEIAQGDELALYRSMSKNGRGKVLINGSLGTVALLEELASNLLTICNQNQHVKLLQASYHREVLDGYAGLSSHLAKYQQEYRAWRAAVDKLNSMETGAHENARRRAEQEFVVSELSQVEMQLGRREKLEMRVNRYAGAEKLLVLGREIEELMIDEHGLVKSVSTVGTALSEMQSFDHEVSPLAELFNSAATEIREFERELSTYLSSITVDEETLELLRDELATIARLERKYQTDEEGLIHLLEESKAALAKSFDENAVEALRDETASLQLAVQRLADELSKRRLAAGKKLARAIKEELKDLNMPGAAMTVQIESAGEPGPVGQDQVEILISTNKGEPQRELRKIASGGELSRILLVLKKLLRDRSGVNVLVFDEVDSGISGGVARSVGEKLRGLAVDSQVICITHLPQIASLANHNYRVDKQVKDGRTISRIELIRGEEKVDEIARMLAGYDVTEKARESARELLSS